MTKTFSEAACHPKKKRKIVTWKIPPFSEAVFPPKKIRVWRLTGQGPRLYFYDIKHEDAFIASLPEDEKTFIVMNNSD